VGVSDFEGSRELFPELAALRFEYRPDEEIPDRHYFRKRSAQRGTHHLSLAEPTSMHYRSTVVFRDALRADPSLARAYEALKLDLARRFPFDRPSYQNGKTAFIVEVLIRHGLVIEP
jgi:GrpB-like predicted nucleotidyltransferase (UPF0157 family)